VLLMYEKNSKGRHYRRQTGGRKFHAVSSNMEQDDEIDECCAQEGRMWRQTSTRILKEGGSAVL
jgi:hypothetical protein